MADELERFQVLPAAVPVGNPGAVFARVIQVQHRRHRVHAQAVDVVAVEPKQRVGDQEVGNFVSAIIENVRAPIRVLAQTRIVVLVQVGAIEAAQAVSIAREMRRHPIQDHAHAGLMKRIHEEHEILRRPVARGRRKVSADLIAPGLVKRMFGHRQQLDVREAHFVRIGGEFGGDFAVREPAVVCFRLAHPGA